MDLSRFDDEALNLWFRRITEPLEHEGHFVSIHPHKWFLTHWGGCSCHFRQSVEVYGTDGIYQNTRIFRPQVDWSPEDPDDVAATYRVYEVIQLLLTSGAEVDCVQVWNEFDLICHMDVSLSEVPKEHFSFAEDYCYHFLL